MPEPKLVYEGVHPLPPLILHPFSESAETAQILDSARASLSMLEDAEGQELLDRRVLEGRFAELRMVFYVGKDVCRWLDQCVDSAGRERSLAEESLPAQSFAHLLIEQTPPEVSDKLRSWGVVEYARIFSRSIGVYKQFRQAPEADYLQPHYLRYYYRYADFAYQAWRQMAAAPDLEAARFPFTLYASGEYARILEDEWRET